MTVIRWLSAGVAVSAILVCALFWVQNSRRTVALSLDLGPFAWQLSDPVSVPLLIAGSAVGGGIVGMILVSIRSIRLSRRIRHLEQQLAVAAVSGESRTW